MGPVEVTVERPKRSVIDDILAFLRRVLRRVVNFFTCSACCAETDQSEELSLGPRIAEYGTDLSESERAAVERLLCYLETARQGEITLSPDHIMALSILTYSENVDLQKSAALCYLEFSERMRGELSEGMVGPLVDLLRVPNLDVQQIATLALGNLVTHGHENNKEVLVKGGAVSALVHMLKSSANSEVLCNSCGCIAALSIAKGMKTKMVDERGIPPLLAHLVSSDRRVQKNAAGAIVNLTQTESNRLELVRCGAVGTLASKLSASDSDVVHFSVAALSNLALEAPSRAMMLETGNHSLPRQLLKLLTSKEEKILCQACLALRNLASDKESQNLLVRLGILPPLHSIIQSSRGEVLAAAVGCLRNLSIHEDNELPILVETFLRDMCRVLREGNNTEAMKHAAGVIRNLAAGEYVKRVAQSNCVSVLMHCLMKRDTPTPALVEITAALAIFANDEEVRMRLLTEDEGLTFTRLVTLTSLSPDPSVQYNCAGIIGEMIVKGIPEHLLEPNRMGIVLYIDKFLKSPDPSFIHLALWTLNELLNDEPFVYAFQEHHIEHVVSSFLTGDFSQEITELASSAQKTLLNEDGNEEEEVFSSNGYIDDDNVVT